MGIIVIAAAIFCAYLPALRDGFVWDDDSFLTANPLIKASHGLYRIWFTSQGVDYWPLTSSALWLEWRGWGASPLGYHATNLGLHFLATLVLWAVLRRLRIPGGFVAALIFALHPVNVESVAWITQQKNLIAMVFSLLSIFCFLQSDLDLPAPTASLPRAGRWYGLSLLAFALAMLGKASSAMLPVAILGCIAWRRRLATRDFFRLAPFGIVSAGLTGIAIALQHRSMEGAVRNADWIERGLGAGAALWFYLFKALIPLRLAFVYPLWSIQAGGLQWWAPLLALAAFSAVLWRCRRNWSRPILFAWGYFCVSLVPVLGLTDVYFMNYSLVADHYEHLAMIGVAASIAAAWEGWRRRPAARGRIGAPIAVATLVLLVLGALTWRQCRFFADAETLYRATLRENPASAMAYNNLGILLAKKGRATQARLDFKRAVLLKPDWAEAHFNFGIALQQAGRNAEANDQYGEALRLRPDFRQARLALAGLLAGEGRFPEAEAQDKLALAWADDAATHCQLGDALSEEGRMAEAVSEYRLALRLDPGWRPARDRLKQLGE